MCSHQQDSFELFLFLFVMEESIDITDLKMVQQNQPSRGLDEQSQE